MTVRAHGTYVKYVIDRCRCLLCRDANADYERRRRQRIEPAYVSAGKARRHLVELQAAGVGLKTVAKVSGLAHGGLSKLVYGDSSTGRPPSRRIRYRTQDLILAVSPADAAPHAPVPAAATWELIDEMVAAGVPKIRIAEGIGQSGPGLQLGRSTILAKNARRVAALHASWRSGAAEFVRHSRHGSSDPIVAPSMPARVAADISDLMGELASIVEERATQSGWRSAAACRGRPTYLWFPAVGDDVTQAAGLKVCAACLVQPQCRDANLNQTVGVYAGMSAKARRLARSAA